IGWGDALSLLQASSRRQDRNVLERIIRQVRENGVHALELVGRECTWQEGLVLAMVLPGPVVNIQVAGKVGTGLGLIKRCILIFMILVYPGLLSTGMVI